MTIIIYDKISINLGNKIVSLVWLLFIENCTN